jgi:WD40 repeat protein
MQTIAPHGVPPFPIGAPPEMPPAERSDALRTMIPAESVGRPVLGSSPTAPARYELGDEIARGGMGRVVDARDTLLGRVVALKEALGLDADALKRFARETRITARLEHPAIVPVHDAGTMPNGAPYYVMRKISGRPLERLVAESTALNDRLALVPHIVAAANAIAHAHARGIVHRDIKPSNILAGDLGETVVIDWGLAKVIGEADDLTAMSARVGDSPSELENDESIKTRAGIVFGTPGFMAPEQLRGSPVDERCDVYALGATLYHLLSRRPPHHAKTADEMMKAAANQPPMPIGELVPGVPPELSTIVDKSLAHDPAQRYQDARTLAEDLQRFLTGQLVASHHYSASERLWRFIRRHRVPVMISIAALIALGIVAAIAVTRVVGERDRADDAAQTARAEKRIAEEERGRAEDRLDKLLLTQARSQVATNPTLAVAMLKPLAVRHWREVRAIAEAARAAGVAWSLPASKRTAAIEMSRDGLRALVAGDDGVIRLHDLPSRKTRIIAERPTPAGAFGARFLDAERRIIVWSGQQLAVIDPSGAAGTTELAVPAPIRGLDVAGQSAYWTDDKGNVWRYELGASTPLQLPLDERVDRVSASPNGRWIALWGERHLSVLDRTRPGPPEPRNVILGVARDLDWSADGSYFAALVDLSGDGHALLVEVDDEPTIRQRRFVGQRFFVAHSNKRAYTVGPLGISVVGSENHRALTGDPVGVRESRGGTVVVGSTSTVVVMSAAGIVELKVPSGRVEIIEASPRSPFVLAAIDHQVIVWNLDDVQPRILGNELPQLARFVGDRVLASYVEDPARLYDLSRGTSRELPRLALRDVKANADGSVACALDAANRAQLITNLAAEPVLEDLGVADLAAFPAPSTLLLAQRERASIRVRDVAKRSERVLATRTAGRLADLAWSHGGSTIAASFDDGTLWRYDLAGGSSTTTALPAQPAQLVVAPDGTVLFPQGRDLRAWRPGGAIESFAMLPRAILGLGLATSTSAFAFTERDGNFLIDLSAADAATRAIETGFFEPKRSDVALEAGTLVVASPSGIDILDPAVRYRWTLAQSSPESTYGRPQISADGRRVMAQTGDSLLVWTFVAPTGATATATWLAEMTNATTAPATGVLTWQ